MLRFSFSHRSIRAIASISNPSSLSQQSSRPFSSSSSSSSFLGLRPLSIHLSSQSILALSIATAFALTLTSTVAFSDASLSPPTEDAPTLISTTGPSSPSPIEPLDLPPLSATDFSDLDSEPDLETDCSFCQSMRSSPCGNPWRRWERCVAKYKTDENPEGFITMCSRETVGLAGCMESGEFGEYEKEIKAVMAREAEAEEESQERKEEEKKEGKEEEKVEEKKVDVDEIEIEAEPKPIEATATEPTIEAAEAAIEVELLEPPPLSTIDFSDLDDYASPPTFCSMCNTLKASPCANPYKRWERCCDAHKTPENPDEYVIKCQREFQAMTECMIEHGDYFKELKEDEALVNGAVREEEQFAWTKKETSDLRTWINLTSTYLAGVEVLHVDGPESIVGPKVKFVKAVSDDVNEYVPVGSVAVGVADYSDFFVNKNEDDDKIKAIWIRQHPQALNGEGLFLGVASKLNLTQNGGKVLFSVPDDTDKIDLFMKMEGGAVVCKTVEVVRVWA